MIETRVFDAYQLFLDAVDTFLQTDKLRCDKQWYEDLYSINRIYEIACLKAPVLEKEFDIVALLREKAKPNDGTGLFLSALLNKGGHDGFFIDKFPALDCIGHELRKDKYLILGKEVTAQIVGQLAEGDILSWADTRHLGYSARDGFQGNWGECWRLGADAYTGFRAQFAPRRKRVIEVGHGINDGLQVNFTIADRLAEYATGGVVLNLGKSGCMSWGVEDGFQANFGTVDIFDAARAGVQYTAGTVKKESTKRDGVSVVQKDSFPAIDAKLDTLISELRFFEQFKDAKETDAHKILDAIKKYDYKQATKNFIELYKKLKE